MKRKITINRPGISSEEIAKRKNFDSVLKHHSGAGKPLFKKPLFLSSVLVAVLAIVTTVLVLTKNHQPAFQQSEIPTHKDTTALAEFNNKENHIPFINPPLKGLDIDYTIYKVIAENGAALQFKTGSKLVVPKNAFEDGNGKPLKGEVELRYREFHDAADFFVSGIPMTYDSAGVKYQFESAGMMEMQGYQHGKKVSIAKDKAIAVELVSTYKGTEYNLYALDTLHNNWSCLGKDKVTEKSGNKDITEVNSKPLNRQQEKMADSVSKFVSKATVEKEKKISELINSTKVPIKPKQSQHAKYTFDIAVEPKEFPELAIYKGVLFEIGAENKSFNPALYDVTWDDANLKEGTKKGENYLLTLKKGSNKYEFIVYPVFEGKNFETAKTEYDYLLKEYNNQLEIRKQKEKQIEDAYNAMIAFGQKMAKEQQKKEKEREANQFKLMDTQEKVSRLFAINKFGVYNSDCPKNYPQGAMCTATLINNKKATLQCYNVYLVDKEKNGIFTYYKNPVTQFSYNPASKNMIWTVEDGVLFWFKPEQFKDLKSGEMMTSLKMTRVEQKFANVDDFKTYFNF